MYVCMYKLNYWLEENSVRFSDSPRFQVLRLFRHCRSLRPHPEQTLKKKRSAAFVFGSLRYSKIERIRNAIQTFAPAFPTAPGDPVRPTLPCLWLRKCKWAKSQINCNVNFSHICFLSRPITSFYIRKTYKQTAMNELSHPHPSSPCGSSWSCESSDTLKKERKDVYYFRFAFLFNLQFPHRSSMKMWRPMQWVTIYKTF